jgi:rod shape determining protein RodA
LRRQEEITKGIDWITVIIYGVLVLWGWLNIFATVYDAEASQSIFDLSLNSGKQLLWIGTAIILITVILNTDYKFFDAFAYIIYGVVILSLVAVLLLGRKVAGSQSWFEIGTIRIQPSEFAKFAAALAVSKYLSGNMIRGERLQTQITAGAIIFFPALLILAQNDTGSFLVFTCFLIVLFREGMSPVPIILGFVFVAMFILTLVMDKMYLFILLGVVGVIVFVLIRKKLSNILLLLGSLVVLVGFVYSVDYLITNVLQPHQQNRIKALINPDADPLGFGWNVTQSKIAIGSGGFFGKGYLKGTHTKFDFVPEQSTDFIFCTIGEEEGWLGALILIGLYLGLFARIIYLAERQKLKFARIYGYCVVAIFFFHFTINIGMTIGLFPVIGIPLPFMSYGGSSLWSFTILLFIFLNLDANKRLIL